MKNLGSVSNNKDLTTKEYVDNVASSKLGTTGNGSNVTVAFTQATERTNVSTGVSLSTAFSRIAKFFSDLKTVAFTGNYNDLTNKPVIAEVPQRATVTVSANNTSSISIPSELTGLNILLVYHNGLLLTPTTHYTATTSAITLVGYTANAGDIFTFISQ